jgi:uncharacterized protein
VTTQWRAAVRRLVAGAAAAEIDVPGPSFNYRWEHVTSVVTLALRLADLVGANRDIVEAAAWLHDITKRDGGSHATSGASFARDFLPQTDFPSEKIDQVARAIADHKGLWRDEPLTELESMVLWDADKLSKIGLTAAFHWTGMALAGDRLTSLADLITASRDTSWLEKTVASMHTAPARQAARTRLEAYNLLYSNLEAELKGDDLETN